MEQQPTIKISELIRIREDLENTITKTNKKLQEVENEIDGLLDYKDYLIKILNSMTEDREKINTTIEKTIIKHKEEKKRPIELAPVKTLTYTTPRTILPQPPRFSLYENDDMRG